VPPVLRKLADEPVQTFGLPPSWRRCRPRNVKRQHCGDEPASGGDQRASHSRRPRQERNPPRYPASRPHDLATLESVSSAKFDRDQDALLQAARRARHGTRLRQAGGRTADQGRDPEPLHGLGDAANSTRGMSLFKGRGSLASGRFVQQSRAVANFEIGK